MAGDGLTFLGGLLLGLASSLHCAAMCGAIASSLMFAFSNGDAAGKRVEALLAAHAGRVLIYVGAGAALGAFGSTIYSAFDHAHAYLFMRWAAAVALGWIGLSVAGLAPSLAVADRVAAPIASALRFGGGASVASGPAGAFASGIVWGLLPCGMVYGALFYAMLSGGALQGAMVMAGFGLGTLPSVTGIALGVASFRRLARRTRARLAVGLGIVALAAASLAVPAMSSTAFCFG
ncbi:MAG TPA: sulfite exporter TauE/SafE family protein [Roseiarcus sp.]|nr:sulfite exporter TauE/SafE family protein [Roseiarcus sp.]